MLHSPCRLDRVAEYNGACIVLSGVLAVLLAEQLEWLDLVVVSKSDEFVLEVAQVEMCAFLNDYLEVGVSLVKKAPGHRRHPFAYSSRAHDDLLVYYIFSSARKVLLDDLAQLGLVTGIEESV